MKNFRNYTKFTQTIVKLRSLSMITENLRAIVKL